MSDTPIESASEEAEAPAPEPKIARLCGTCMFWINPIGGRGACWGFAPTPMPDGSARRPYMSEDEFCGVGWRPAERLLGGKDVRAG
jgi:hypothetical protein